MRRKKLTKNPSNSTRNRFKLNLLRRSLSRRRAKKLDNERQEQYTGGIKNICSYKERHQMGQATRTCGGYFLRYVAYFYRFYVLYAMYHPLLCLAEA